MDIKTSEPEELPIKVITAKQAREGMPQFQPVDHKLFRKVMAYSFAVIEQRKSAGFSYVNLSLTKMPELESKRIKTLRRLHFEVREQEFELAVIWNKE